MSGKPSDVGNNNGDPIRVFLSYRRSDDRNFVGRFHDRLVARYGQDNVFMDIDSIHAGSNFSAVIAEQVAMVDAVIVMIGPTWATRLPQPGDLVRMEVAESIAAQCAVVPVLIEDTPIPAAGSLPADLDALLALNISRVRGGVDFHRDTTRTLEGLEAGVVITRRAIAERAAAEARRLAAEAQLIREQAEAERKARRQPESSDRSVSKARRWLVPATIVAALIAVSVTYAAWPSGGNETASPTTSPTASSEAPKSATTSSPVASTTAVPADDLLTILARDYKVFFELVSQDENAMRSLNRPMNTFTVFAPTDEALHDLSTELANVPAIDTAVQDFVEYHLAVSSYTDTSFGSLGGETIALESNGSGGYTIDDVSTIGTEVEALNGRLFPLDAPLWSPKLNVDRPKSLAQTTDTSPTTTTVSGGPSITTSPAHGTTPATTPATTLATTPAPTVPAGFAFTGISPSSTSVTAGSEKTIQVTVSWVNAPEGGEYLCIGRSEANVPHDAGGYPLAYMVQSGNCSTISGTNGSGTLQLLIGGNFVGTATYRLFDAEGRAQGSKTFTITVV
ncbi:hypothetical protein BH10ACT2_BH10ACT2_04470 [soil metagenome]